jgi:ribonuclease HI/exonuclease III
MAVTENIKIWQQNVNKSRACQHSLISSNHLVREGINFIALQEPVIDPQGFTIAARDWTPIYPSQHLKTDKTSRAITFVRADLSSDSWKQMDFPSADVVAIQLKGLWGKLTIVNIYNDGGNDETVRLLSEFHHKNRNELERSDTGEAHVLWLGDFNRHHPYWDDPNDGRLFTKDAVNAAEKLIEAIADAGLELALPSGIPTHRHNVTKKWSRLDQVFITDHSENTLITCDTQPDQWGINTDHLPILTALNLRTAVVEADEIPNFCEVDWEEFRKELKAQLAKLPPGAPIVTQDQLDTSCAGLTKAIQTTINSQVPSSTITSKSKRWWTKELTQLRRAANRLGRQSYRNRLDEDHAVHAEHAAMVKRYHNTLDQTKRHHWRDWLEKAEDPDIWAAHRLTSSSGGDGGKSKIPVLKYKVGDADAKASDNGDKGRVLAKYFFPDKPPGNEALIETEYPRACERVGKITPEQIEAQLKKLKPYKAPGPDGIPNIVLTKCADLVTERLCLIYRAMLDLSLMYKPWKEFVTVVLRKPGKPNYDIPKAYRPIALLNTMWKTITAIIANHITYLTEKHQLLPANHFGGRPGRTTTDAVHLLTAKIKDAWRSKKVTSVLFLDIEGAFPNANPDRLVDNLRKREIPAKYAKFVRNMLEGRVTTLKFDGYASDQIPIDNGIGQGDPLSMVLYQYYNADLLDIPEQDGEDAIAYVDDTIMMATGADFNEAHRKLEDMMCRTGGVGNWSETHSSPLEYSKLALINFAHRHKDMGNPTLQLPQRTIHPGESTKYLGVFIDRKLNWKVQQAYAVEKGAKWMAQIRRLTRPTWGITPKYAKRLFMSVALPRVLYAVDVWCTPTNCEHPGPKAVGSAKVTRQLTSIQRAGALAITGGLRSSPTDALNASAFLLPTPATIDKWCHRAYIRMATLPQKHPLFKQVNWKKTSTTRRHKGPLHNLAGTYNLVARNVEKIPSFARNPSKTGKNPFQTSIPIDKEASVLEAANAKEEIQVFSDGSAHGGKVGAAAVLIRKNHPDRTLHLHLGRESEHTVHEAELVGLLLALHLIRTEKKNNTTCMVAVDNQATLKAFDSDLRKPGHHLAREALRIANQLKKRKNKRKYKLMLRWTAGHVGISGNEKADREAKKAASDFSSQAHLLPPYLRKSLCSNPSALKRGHNDKLKKDWNNKWRQSTRGKRAKRLDNTTPSVKFLKTISNEKLSRKAASQIAQLRMQHFPLNGYLHKIKRTDKANCPACGEDVESITHFLITCPSYAHERWALAQQARRIQKNLTVESLLGEPGLAIPLANYIDSTCRFRANPGEQT